MRAHRPVQQSRRLAQQVIQPSGVSRAAPPVARPTTVAQRTAVAGAAGSGVALAPRLPTRAVSLPLIGRDAEDNLHMPQVPRRTSAFSRRANQVGLVNRARTKNYGLFKRAVINRADDFHGLKAQHKYSQRLLTLPSCGC